MGERWEQAGIALEWTPEKRLLEVRFVEKSATATGPQARALVDQVDRWTSASKGLGILVDCENLIATAPAWRSVCSRYFGSRPYPVLIAWHSVTMLIRVAAQMFVLATPGVDGKAFHSEDDARSYLRNGGYG